jgi:uridine kinase
MEYKPGIIHERLQKEHFFLIEQDFYWINCNNKRWKELSNSEDWDDTNDVELFKGDIIVIRYFKPGPLSEVYAYTERVIKSNGEVINYQKESITARDLIDINPLIFINVTKQIERDKQIEKILE